MDLSLLSMGEGGLYFCIQRLWCVAVMIKKESKAIYLFVI